MKKIIVLLCAVTVFCATSYAQTTITDSILVDGIYRSFIFRTPASFTQARRPLIINMHGFRSNAIQQEYYTNFDALADTAGFYLVMPEGTSYFGSQFWNVGVAGSPNVDDLKFISSLIDTLQARHPDIDRTQVYATGYSNGGYMSYLLAAQLSNKVAAIASVAGAIAPGKFPTLSPPRAIPIMEIHGDADTIVPYAGFANSIHVDTVMAAWVRWNGCNPIPVKTSVPNTNTTDGCTANKYVWSGGRNGSEVILYRIVGGGHTWPGSAYIIDITNQDMSATQEIWRFFRKYRLTTTTVGSVGVKDGPAWFSPNPASSTIRIHTSGTTTVSDLSGRMLLQSTAKDIDLRGLPPGSYMLQCRSANGTRSATFVKE